MTVRRWTMPATPTHSNDQRLGSHVTVLTGEHHGKYPDGNSVVVVGSTSSVVIDPSLTVHRRPELHRAVDKVLLSHAHEDHMAGLEAVAPRSVHVHQDDLVGVASLDGLMQVYGLPPDESTRWRREVEAQFNIVGWPSAEGFADGETFDLGGVSVTALHLPGHTRGHSAFVIEPDGVAFIGDVDLSGFGPYYGDHWSDLDDFVSSIERVRSLEAKEYVTFHHKGVVHGQAEFIRQLDAFGSVITQRDERLLTLLRSPHTFDQLVEIGLVYRPGSRPAMFGESVERQTIQRHLDRFARTGDVIRVGSEYLAAGH